MHSRRLAAFLLGGWIAGSLLMLAVARENFRSTDRLLASPAPAAAGAIEKLGITEARALLRYQVAEENRWFLEAWQAVQLAIGVLLIASLLLGERRFRRWAIVPGLMVLLVAVTYWLLTPEIIRLGRAIDFVPVDQPSPERTRFWNFQMAGSATELVKLALAAVLAVKLLRRGRRGSTSDRRRSPAEAADR